MARLATWLALGFLGHAAAVCADGAGGALRPVGHSALLTLEAAAAPQELTLRVRTTAAAQAPLAVTSLAVTVDGRPLPATARSDGTWRVALAGVKPHADARLEVVVAHDGIREVLNGQIELPAVPATQGGGAGGLLRDHKQLAWWILNIGIVLIGAIAISRRMS